MNNTSKKNLPYQVLMWIFPILFLIDNILGFNGYQFTVFGKSIRIILFSISVILLFTYCLAVMVKDKISLFNNKRSENTLWKLLRPFDYFVLLFVLGNLLWATLIPSIVRGETVFSLKDFSTLLVLILYFPIVFLFRTHRFDFKMFEKILYVLLVILALWHCVMYIGESISHGFYELYYDFIDYISLGTAVRSQVVYGYGIVRVIQTTSILLLPGIFMCLRYLVNGKWYHIVFLFVFTFAICVTYTKSIWFGYLAGLIVYLCFCIFNNKQKQQQYRSMIVLPIAVIMIVVLNFSVFNNSIFERAVNTVRSQQSIEKIQEDINQAIINNVDITEANEKLKDALGTQQANNLRSMQNNELLNKWKNSKWFGFGYGSYAENCIRNEQFPYMYESTLPALIMKLGIIGCLMWAVFIFSTTVCAIKMFWKTERNSLFFWLATAFSYALSVQTNPFLFTFAGISVLLYVLLFVQCKIES